MRKIELTPIQYHQSELALWEQALRKLEQNEPTQPSKRGAWWAKRTVILDWISSERDIIMDLETKE